MKCMNSGIYFFCVSIFLFNCDSKLLGQASGHYPISVPNYSYFQEDPYSNLYLNFGFENIGLDGSDSEYISTNPSTQNPIKFQLGYIRNSAYDHHNEGLTSADLEEHGIEDVDYFHPFADSNISDYTVTYFPGDINFAVRMYVEAGSALIGEGYIIKNSWNLGHMDRWSGNNNLESFSLSDIYINGGGDVGIASDVTLINIDAWHGVYSGHYLNLNLPTPSINKNLIDTPNSFDFSEVDFATISITPENASYGDYIRVEAVPNEGIIFKEWEGSPILVNEDLDADGRLDLGTEDIDGDGNFDVLSEDLNNDGNQDLGEDRNGNGILDFGEDLDGDGNLDLSEDLDGNGELNFADFDFDRDGNFDLLYENFDNDGNFDTSNEDLDGDGNFDIINEDSNSNGILDSTNINDNPILVQYAGSFELNAKFIVDESDPDNDQLPTWLEVYSLGTSPVNYDTNNDGVGDYFIYNNNLSPTFNYSSFLNQLSDDYHFLNFYGLQSDYAYLVMAENYFTTLDAYNLVIAERDARPTQASYDAIVAERDAKLTLEEVAELRPGSTMIEVTGNQATVQLQMEESSDLQTWEDKGDPATMTIPADTDTKFFRFKMAE